MTALGIVVAALLVGAAPLPSANVAPCEGAVIGSGPADWRRRSIVAGPVAVFKPPLANASETRNGQFLKKLPILVVGRAPEAVTVSVPRRLRKRVFLYYGRVIGRDGEPTTSFAEARGYSETEFQLCADKPRTVWPGGIRVKGRRPVHLLIHVEGRASPIRLPLGRPRPL